MPTDAGNMRLLGTTPPTYGALERWRYVYIDSVTSLSLLVLLPVALVKAVIGTPLDVGSVLVPMVALSIAWGANRRGRLLTASSLLLGTTTLINWISSVLQSHDALMFAALIIVGAGVLIGPRSAVILVVANLCWLALWALVSERAGRSQGPLEIDLAILLVTSGGIGVFVSTMLTSTIGELESQRQALLVALTRASTDGLTGLANHASLAQRLEEEMARSRRHESPLSVVMFDLDHFKRINDAHGHPVGDEVLRRTGRRLRALGREGDVVGRYGGEEFCVILPHTDRQGARLFADRVRTAIATMELPVVGSPLQLTLSAGVATREAGDSSGIDLLARADQALYAAKAAGRDRTVVDDGVPEVTSDPWRASASRPAPSASGRAR